VRTDRSCPKFHTLSIFLVIVMVVKYILWVDKKIKNLVGLSLITKTEHNVKI